MPYNIEEISLATLEKILLTMNNIRDKFEIDNSLKDLDMGIKGGINGVSQEEHDAVIKNLKEAKILIKPFILPQSGKAFISVSSKEKFYNFYTQITERIKELKGEKQNKADRLEFNESNSILMIKEYKIPIARRKEKTDEHDILKALFKDKNEECFYSELAEDILGIENEDYKNNQKYWQKFYGACGRIQEKVSKKTENKINDFLDFNTGIKGSVKINEKYIP